MSVHAVPSLPLAVLRTCRPENWAGYFYIGSEHYSAPFPPEAAPPPNRILLNLDSSLILLHLLLPLGQPSLFFDIGNLPSGISFLHLCC